MFYTDEDGEWVVQFGEGTIMVMAGHPAGHPGIGTVSFLRHKEPHPIGQEDQNLDKCIGHQTNELDGYCPGARLVFTKTESIDVVIQALQDAKKFMIDKTDLTLLKP
jgi:hypothetical protein